MEHFHCFAAFFAQSLAGLFAWHHFVKIITAHVAMLESQLLHNCHLCRKNTKNSYCIYSLVNRPIAQLVFFSAIANLLRCEGITTLWNGFHDENFIPILIDTKWYKSEISYENQACYTSKYHRPQVHHDDHCVWTKNDCAPIFLVDIKNRWIELCVWMGFWHQSFRWR